MVSYGATRKKVISLPPSQDPDLVVLKRALLHAMLQDNSVEDLGGNSTTSCEDIVMFRYDNDFCEEVEVTIDLVIEHGDKNLIAKLREISSNRNRMY